MYIGTHRVFMEISKKYENNNNLEKKKNLGKTSKIKPNQTKTIIPSWLNFSVAHVLNKSIYFHSNIVGLRMYNWAKFKSQ